MILNRRNFLKTLSACAVGNTLASCTHKKFFNPDEDIFLSGGEHGNGEQKKFALIAVNLIQQEKRVIDTPFLPHGITINPNNKYSVFCFEKNGQNACEIDLQTESIIRSFLPEKNQQLSGHASFSNDGKFLYCVEKNTNNRQGSISIRETKSLKITHRLPTLGLAPHHSHITKSNTLIISNTGASESGFHHPSIIYIDLATEKLIERVTLNDKNLNCGHFKVADNNLIIASAPVDKENNPSSGGVSIRLHNQPISTMIEPNTVISRMQGEALGIAVNQQRSIAAITHPEANLITFWSVKNKKIIKAYGFEKPRGVSQTLDKKHFLLSYGNKPAMVTISLDDLSPQIESLVQPTFTSGEHIINWSATLREIMPTSIYS